MRVAIKIFHRRSEEYADARPRHLVPTFYETISIRMKRYYEKKLIQITNPVRENLKICELEIPGRAPIGRDVCSVYNWNVFLHCNTRPFQGGNAFKENPKKETTMATKNQTQFGRTFFFVCEVYNTSNLRGEYKIFERPSKRTSNKIKRTTRRSESAAC